MHVARSYTVVNVGYRSTNYWVISAGTSRLLVDLGYPNTMGLMRANLDRLGVPLGELRYGLATHYHLDHAGLAQELKQLGVPLLVMDVQVPAIPRLKDHMKPRDRYVDITLHDNVTVTCEQSRATLRTIGIDGEIVHTPGHSPDSVSLLLDGGEVFTGDLTPMSLAGEDPVGTILASWRRLLRLGAKTIHPGHGPIAAMYHAEQLGTAGGC